MNGQPAKPDLIIRNGDRIECVILLAAHWERSIPNVLLRRNVVHKHEPPVTSTPVKVLFEDPDHEYIVVNKPGSIVRPSPLLSPPPLLTAHSPYP